MVHRALLVRLLLVPLFVQSAPEVQHVPWILVLLRAPALLGFLWVLLGLLGLMSRLLPRLLVGPHFQLVLCPHVVRTVQPGQGHQFLQVRQCLRLVRMAPWVLRDQLDLLDQQARRHQRDQTVLYFLEGH